MGAKTKAKAVAEHGAVKWASIILMLAAVAETILKWSGTDTGIPLPAWSVLLLGFLGQIGRKLAGGMTASGGGLTAILAAIATTFVVTAPVSPAAIEATKIEAASVVEIHNMVEAAAAKSESAVVNQQMTTDAQSTDTPDSSTNDPSSDPATVPSQSVTTHQPRRRKTGKTAHFARRSALRVVDGYPTQTRISIKRGGVAGSAGVLCAVLLMAGCVPSADWMRRSDALRYICVSEAYYQTKRLPDGTSLTGEDLEIRLRNIELAKSGMSCAGIRP